jgi:Meiotically up-regulated gene 113
MTKEDILNYIKVTTKGNNGIPLGELKFYELTPVKKSDWHGKIWLRWSEAVAEAGLEPNQFFSQEIPKEEILEEIAKIIIEIKKFPSESELKFFHFNRKTIPSTTVIWKKIGRKFEIATELLEYCKNQTNFKEVAYICEEIVFEHQQTSISPIKEKEETLLGKVYLMKSGKFYKIGKTDHIGQRHYSIGIKLPEKLELIHEFSTDDPFGIEKYWHNRFKDKRLEGEWFDLTSDDIKAFKRRKNFM